MMKKDNHPPYTYEEIKESLLQFASPSKAQHSLRFFKTGKGEYGEGDQMAGITVPEIRTVLKICKPTPLREISKLLEDPIHECRFLALLYLVERYNKQDENQREQIVNLYLSHLDHINNWDLVDCSAPKIIGRYVHERDRKLLYDLAQENHLWKQRIAIVSTLHLIRQGEFNDTLQLAKLLLNHPHDLIHKAVGWMLREVGKKDKSTLCQFLDQYAKKMPRTALRYAIEHFPAHERKHYMS